MSAEQQTEAAEASAPAGPVISVLGDASEEQLAALIAVLSGLGGGDEPPATVRTQWGHPQRALRTSFSVGPGGWRLSGLPR